MYPKIQVRGNKYKVITKITYWISLKIEELIEDEKLIVNFKLKIKNWFFKPSLGSLRIPHWFQFF